MFIWNKSKEQIINDIGVNSRLQKFACNECYRQMIPYVPFDTGLLSQNVDIKVDDKKGVIEFKQPYAHYQYVGEFNWNKTHHPLATNYWDKAMWVTNKEKITRAVDLYRRQICK